MIDLEKNFSGIITVESPEHDLLKSLDPGGLPRHIAIIMDGNGRWARGRGLPRIEGHRAGADSVRSVLEYTARLQIPYLTLYAFSSENWKRPKEEINGLWHILRSVIKKEIPTLKKNGIAVNPIGRLNDLPDQVRRELELARSETSGNKLLTMSVALNYSSRNELVDAFNRIMVQRKDPGTPITEKEIQANLYTADLPDPDLLIRSSGEFRLSNFLLWQVAYAEIYITPVLWPDFRGIHLLEAILDFQRRERRFGAITPSGEEDS